jgi:hypothetical protein
MSIYEEVEIEDMTLLPVPVWRQVSHYAGRTLGR